MGQIVFHCKKCNAKLSAELDEVGAAFECPKCGAEQSVPGTQSSIASHTSPGTPIQTGTGSRPVTHIPKRRVVVTKPPEEEEEIVEEEYEEIPGGVGLALFAIALGTAGLLLCVVSMVWMLISDTLSKEWWISFLVFLSTFLMGLMGLVLAQLARLVVRLADHIARLTYEEED